MMHKHHFYVMEVSIKTLTGASLQLLVSPCDSVYNLKFRIQSLEGIPISQQHLIWQSVELEDDRMLHEYHIHNGATLQLVLGMRGGPVNTRRVPSEEPAPQDMADIYLAEYLSETHGEPVSPSGRRPVTYIVYQTGDHFNLYCVFDRDGSAASDHRELLFGGAELTDDKDSPLPGARREENEKTREKMQLVRSQMENMSLMKERKAKMSRKPHPSRPPSSRSASRQKLHRLTTAAVSVRPPSVFSKNPPLPPIGSSALNAASLSPVSNSSASVPLGMSATPAAEASSCEKCSSTLSPNVENAELSNSITVTSNDDTNVSATSSQQPKHHRFVQLEAPAVETDSKCGSRYNSTKANDEQRAEMPSLTAGALGDGPSSQISGLAVERSKRQSSARAAGSITGAVTDCSSSSAKLMSEDKVIDLPLVSPGSARLKAADAACQCDEISSRVNTCESGTQAVDDCDRQMPASAAGADDACSSTAHPLPDKTRNPDWWSKELVSASSILGVSPSPSRRLRSGANSRTARKFHGLNAHEMQTMSNMLNTLARSQSRAAGGDSTGAAGCTAGTNTAESRVPTTERLRLTSSRSQLRKLSAGRSRGSAGFRLPSVKVAVRKKSSKRCSICGKKTRLANGFQCRCGNNYCTLHRYAEAHACTFDYKSEGRKLIEQNNPVITASKLPKI